MSKVSFSSPKYQAVIAIVNDELSKDDNVSTLRRRFMARFHEVPTLTKAGASTYFANVTEDLRATAAPRVATVQVVGQFKKVMSVVTVDQYNVCTAVEYYQDDSYLDVDTTGKKLVKGYQVIGKEVGTIGTGPSKAPVVQLDPSMFVG